MKLFCEFCGNFWGMRSPWPRPGEKEKEPSITEGLCPKCYYHAQKAATQLTTNLLKVQLGLVKVTLTPTQPT